MQVACVSRSWRVFAFMSWKSAYANVDCRWVGLAAQQIQISIKLSSNCILERFRLSAGGFVKERVRSSMRQCIPLSRIIHTGRTSRAFMHRFYQANCCALLLMLLLQGTKWPMSPFQMLIVEVRHAGYGSHSATKACRPMRQAGQLFWHILSTPPAQALDGLLFLVVFRKASGKQDAKKKRRAV